MSDAKLGPVLKAVLRWILPRDRAQEILCELTESLQARTQRIGAGAARSMLWREVASLVVWRIRSGGRVAYPSANEDRGGTMLGRDFMQDIRFGVRTLRRQPAFTATAVLVLGLGIGAPTTVFSLVNRIFFVRPAEVVEPHRLVRLYREWSPGEGGGSLGHPDYVYYRDAANTLAGLAAYSGGGLIASYSTGPDEIDQLGIQFVSDNFFDVLGARPLLGREFTPEENATAGTHPVMVVSHGFWTRSLGGDPEVVGRTLTLNGGTYTVVGVMPEEYRGIAPTRSVSDAWVPIAMNGSLTNTNDPAWWERQPESTSRWLSVIGRLSPGVTFQAAEANLLALSDAHTYEGKDPDEGLWVRRQFLYSPRQADQLRGLSTMLLIIVGIVLTIAVANVTVLLLSRATTRSREIGVRTAMGAGRGRIMRQLLAESLLLGLAGGALGVLIAYATSDLAATLMPVSFEGSFLPDTKVVASAVGLALMTSLIVGLAPALQASRTDLRGAIHSTGAKTGKNRVRGALVVGQLGLSLILVAGSLLFMQSFWAARSQPVGFESEDRLMVRLNLQGLGYEPAAGRAFITEGLARISAIPGVRSVSTSRMIPFGGQWSSSFDPPAGGRPNDGEEIYTGMNTVSPDYFDLMGIEILQGRALDESDVEGAPRSVVVNEALAEAVWPGQGAVGKVLPIRGDDDPFTVVGVARNATYYDLGEDPVAQTYASVQQMYRPSMGFLVQTGVPATQLADQVQDAIRGLEPRIAFTMVTTLAAVVDDQVAGYEVTAVLVSLFGVLALILASVGLYGVITFLVSQRTREIGVRMALGADRNRVAGDVLLAGVRLAALGIVVGLSGSFAVRRFTESQLYGVQAGDPLPLIGAALVLMAVTAAASIAPARRATRVDPMEAIRTD